MTLSVKDLWLKGKAARRVEQALGETAKLGYLRGGSAGCVTNIDTGAYVGKCQRKAHLRSQGLQDEVEVGKNLMFDSGFDNEDEWFRALKNSWHGVIKREDEIPTSWFTENGTKVTGRPDIVLCEIELSTTIPKHLIELKKVSGIWTANNVHYKLIPSTDHIVQSCHYMWQLGINGSLVYSSAVDWHVPFNMKRSWHGKPDIEYREGQHGAMEPFKVVPFIREYQLEIRDGVMWYHTEGLPSWVETTITVAGVKAYYESVSKIKDTNVLGPRPSQLNSIGLKASYSECDFCPYQEVCNKYESSYDRWLDEVKAVLGLST